MITTDQYRCTVGCFAGRIASSKWRSSPKKKKQESHLQSYTTRLYKGGMVVMGVVLLLLLLNPCVAPRSPAPYLRLDLPLHSTYAPQVAIHNTNKK